jgi:predicted patatin/cPLA2 family phospholipase
VTVLELLRDRRRQGSTPGHRDDGARLVLLVEGGSSRGAYSSGMTVAIEQLGLLPMFDAVYGSSAGALNAAWLLCGRAESTMHAWWDPLIMRTTIDPRRVLRRQPVVDTRFLVHTVYTEIMPMGFQEILDNPVEFHPMATDGRTGQAVDLHARIHDQASLQAALRASTAMPFLAGEPVEIDGRPYIDAGISETIPVRTALAQHATHIVALRTRRSDETTSSAPSRGERLVLSRWFARHAPGAMETWLGRAGGRAGEEELLASHPATVQLRPPVGSVRIGRTERRPRLLRAAVDTGRQAGLHELAACVEELL